MFDVWWAYYECEPFGSQWEQTASLAAMMHANTTMMAATHGVKSEAFGVIDFMPQDSLSWRKRKATGSGKKTHPKVQVEILKRAFGFS